MASPAEPTDRADQIFRIGPEDLAARSSIIVAGAVSGYSRDVRRYSAPGRDGVALEWTVHARIDRPLPLKGTPPPAPIHFSRMERSFLAPPSAVVPLWEMNFGELKANGQALLFLAEGSEPRAVPNGDGAEDLTKLVRNIVRIQAMHDSAAQRRGWLEYLASGPSAEGTRAALRSLVRAGAEWNQIDTAIRSLPPDADLRAFAFAFVAFHLTDEAWGKDSGHAADFLCRTFSAEKDVEQQLRQLQSFKLVLRYTGQEPRQESRQPLRERFVKCLEAWASKGLREPQLQEEYQQIRSQLR